METNNKLREALSAALEQVNKVYDILSRPCVVIEEARQGCREARGVLIPALAEPVKYCDALTADERTHKFIEKWEKAHGESIDGKTIIYLSSFSRWLQLPCESEAKK